MGRKSKAKKYRKVTRVSGGKEVETLVGAFVSDALGRGDEVLVIRPDGTTSRQKHPSKSKS